MSEKTMWIVFWSIIGLGGLFTSIGLGILIALVITILFIGGGS